jgi:NADPH-dependent 2,4-dienoyl-CoA reductase/sulfur reductase-like enzyme
VPVALLGEQDRTREPELVLIRHGRMSASPFALFPGGRGFGRTAVSASHGRVSEVRRKARSCGSVGVGPEGGSIANGEQQVLIVGAGPTGLTAAYELRRRGIGCR